MFAGVRSILPSRLLLHAALGAVLGLAGCGGTSLSPPPTTVGTAPPPPPATLPSSLQNVVFLGDSLTAGFQNGSLLDTQQTHGFSNLIATQAGFSIALPLIAPPGYPAVLTLESAGLLPVLGQATGTTTGRDQPSVQPTDLGVPGATLHDLIYTAPSATSDMFTELVLGFPAANTNSQVQEAVALAPSTIILWIGNNDALVADEMGSPSAMTSLDSFTQDFTLLMTELKAKTTAHLVVANIPDVTAIPYMTPAAEVIDAVALDTGLTKAETSQQLGISAGDLLNLNGISDLEQVLSGSARGAVLTTLPGDDVLTAAELLVVQSTIASYNQVIAQQVAAAGGTLVDLHAFYATLASGITISGYHATTAYLGGLFSLDGVHPTNTGYALVANQFIASLNSALTLTIPEVNVAQVAAVDPYFGSNIKPVGGVRPLSLLAARQASLAMHTPAQR